MTPEEKTDQEIWEVLQDIDAHRRVNTHRKNVKFRLTALSWAKKIPISRIEDILRTLEAKGAFEIQKGSSGGRLINKNGDAFYLIIKSTKFEAIYEEYRTKVASANKTNQQKVGNGSAEGLLSTLSDEAKNKLWKTVNALRLAYELDGDISFHLPWEKFERNRASEEDTIANLRNLHRRGFITVGRDILSRDPEKLPHWAKPQIKGAETILDKPDIYHDRSTTVTLKKSFFELKDTLKIHLHQKLTPFDWTTVSLQNLELAQKVINVTLNFFELQPINRLTQTNQIPLSKFTSEKIDFHDVQRVLNRVEGIKVTNEILAKNIQTLQQQIKSSNINADSQRKIFGKLPSNLELQSFIFLQMASLEPLQQVKQIIGERLEKTTPTAHKNGEKPVATTSTNTTYTVNLQNRKVLINSKYILAKPHFNRQNEAILNYLLEEAATKDEIVVNKNKFKENLQLSDIKNLSRVVTELGFTKQIKKVFFPSVSKTSLKFRNRVSEDILRDEGIRIDLLLKQLELIHLENTDHPVPAHTGLY